MPKTPSPALYLELLDSLGAPTWMARDVQQLVQLAKAREPAQQLQQRAGSAAPEQRQPQAAASDALSDSDGSKSEGEGSDGEEGEGGQQRQSDETDVDTLLAMAAAEVCLGAVLHIAMPRPGRAGLHAVCANGCSCMLVYGAWQSHVVQPSRAAPELGEV